MSSAFNERPGGPIEENVVAEAERWFVRVEGEACAPSEHDAFERWRAEPEHARAYEQVQRAWLAFGEMSGHAGFERLSSQALNETEPQRRGSLGRLPLAVAASLVVCALAAVAFVAGRNYTPTTSYATDDSQRSTVQLDDGSQVVLNFGTRLDVQFGGEQRKITLRTGEAIFTVAEDPLRPFIVSTGGKDVIAIGTRFQVRNEMKQVVVTLLEGRIAVESADTDQHVQLAPGEQLKFAPGIAAPVRQSVDAEALASWAAGRLKFDATPLAVALDEVNRYSKIKIRLQDMAFADTPVNGVFDVGDTTSVVAAIEAMLPVEAVKYGRREIVLTRK